MSRNHLSQRLQRKADERMAEREARRQRARAALRLVEPAKPIPRPIRLEDVFSR